MKRTSRELNWQQKYYLIVGHDLFGDAFENEEHFERAWFEHREDFLNYFIPRHPGTRPYAWWKLESSEPRRPLSDVAGQQLAEIKNLSNDLPTWCRELSFGMPSVWPEEYWNKMGENPSLEKHFETQADYLRRLGLLTKEEERSLAKTGGQTPEDKLEPGIEGPTFKSFGGRG
jgi:hypothetical protein